MADTPVNANRSLYDDFQKLSALHEKQGFLFCKDVADILGFGGGPEGNEYFLYCGRGDVYVRTCITMIKDAQLQIEINKQLGKHDPMVYVLPASINRGLQDYFTKHLTIEEAKEWQC